MERFIEMASSYDLLPDGILIYQVEDGKATIKYMNPAAMSMSERGENVVCVIRQVDQKVVCSDDELKRQLAIRNYVISHLDEAIRKSYLEVYYQPIVRTDHGSVCCVEALSRWIDPVQGFLSPDEFVPALEDNLMITKLDLYLFREVCRHLKEEELSGHPLIPVSFNLSRQDFVFCDIFEAMESIVAEYNISRDLIRVEITESTAISNPELIHQVVWKMRMAGYQVWMDDFGSGYSSLNVLHEYEFDEIKLDMVFMRHFNEKARNIIRSIISMAKELGIRTLAEGVETKEQFDCLRDIGCEMVQGYLFSPPQPFDSLMQTLSQKGIPIEYDRICENRPSAS